MQDIKDIGVYNPLVKAITPNTLPTDSGTVLSINNQLLNVVYDAAKTKLDVILGGQVIWTFTVPTDSSTKQLFFKVRPTVVVTKELVSFTREVNGQANPQYKTTLTVVIPTSQGKVTVASADITTDGYSNAKQQVVDSDYVVGVKVKHDNKERVCLIALDKQHELVVNYPHQGNNVFQNIGEIDESTWAINVDGVLIDTAMFKTAIDRLGEPITNPGNGSGTGTNPGTGGGGDTGGGNTGNGGGTGGGTDNPPAEEVKPSYLKLTGYVSQS